MKSPYILATALYIAISATTYGTLAYNIDFNAYPPGTSYTAASGPPNDFSSFSTSYSSTAHIELSAFGLTNSPLVTTITNPSGRATFGMSIAGATSHVITLQMQLSLGTSLVESAYSGPRASIEFTSDVVSPNQTGCYIYFDTDYVGIETNPIVINSYYGLVYQRTNVFSASGGYRRNTPYSLRFVLNTFTHSFSVYLDGNPLAVDAPIAGGLELKHATISIGDLGTTGANGNGAIDNVRLDIQSANAVSFTAISFTNTSSLRMDLTAPAQQMMLMEWSSNLVTWLPLHEWDIIGPTNYTIRAVYVATDEGTATVPDTPATTEKQKYYRAIPWTPPEEWQAFDSLREEK